MTVDSGTNAGKSRYLFITGGSENWCVHYRNQCGSSSTGLNKPTMRSS